MTLRSNACWPYADLCSATLVCVHVSPPLLLLLLLLLPPPPPPQVLVANHMSRVSGVRVSEDGAREIEIMQLLSEPGHPHLIELLGCYHDDNNVYVIMELAEGGDLFDILERVGRFGEANLRPLIQQVASALQYMHAQCVAHRDVSVENVGLKRISGPLQPGAGAGPSVAV
ncbi:MAG: protein kinase domain-containing protein, partial [Allorhizobium sp.]